MAPRINMAGTMRSRARERLLRAIESKRCALVLGFGIALGVVIVSVSCAVASLAPHRAPLLATGLLLIVASSLAGLWSLVAWLRRHAHAWFGRWYAYVRGGRRTRLLLTRLMPETAPAVRIVDIDRPPTRSRRTRTLTLWQTIKANRCPILLGFAIALGVLSVSLPHAVTFLAPHRALLLAIGVVTIVVSSVMCLLGFLAECLGRHATKVARMEGLLAREAQAAAAAAAAAGDQGNTTASGQGTDQNSGRRRGKAPMVAVDNHGSDGGAGSGGGGAEASSSSRLVQASHEDHGKNEIEEV